MKYTDVISDIICGITFNVIRNMHFFTLFYVCKYRNPHTNLTRICRLMYLFEIITRAKKNKQKNIESLIPQNEDLKFYTVEISSIFTFHLNLKEMLFLI